MRLDVVQPIIYPMNRDCRTVVLHRGTGTHASYQGDGRSPDESISLERRRVDASGNTTENSSSLKGDGHVTRYAGTVGTILSNNGFPVTLTKRQREVLSLLCEGLTNKWIGRRLELSEATVKCHVASLYRSLNVSNRLEAVADAYKLGLVRPINVTSSRAAPCCDTRADSFAEARVR